MKTEFKNFINSIPFNEQGRKIFQTIEQLKSGVALHRTANLTEDRIIEVLSLFDDTLVGHWGDGVITQILAWDNVEHSPEDEEDSET